MSPAQVNVRASGKVNRGTLVRPRAYRAAIPDTVAERLTTSVE
ncbi:MAG: hypothetical protein ACM3VX_00610 [Bacteroidota bacterium]